MCGGGGGGYSSSDAARDRAAARREAEAQRIAAENKAQREANAQVAAKRVRSRANTLMTRSARSNGVGTGQTATGGGTQPYSLSSTLMTVLAHGAGKLGGST